ncbi:hypothetical protein F5146DRAFT_1119947 [Armillaria mellea]|nr:hypothetical protein F5146DRAFT_1119947 [Armillaria mellea]
MARTGPSETTCALGQAFGDCASVVRSPVLGTLSRGQRRGSRNFGATVTGRANDLDCVAVGAQRDAAKDDVDMSPSSRYSGRIQWSLYRQGRGGVGKVMVIFRQPTVRTLKPTGEHFGNYIEDRSLWRDRMNLNQYCASEPWKLPEAALLSIRDDKQGDGSEGGGGGICAMIMTTTRHDKYSAVKQPTRNITIRPPQLRFELKNGCLIMNDRPLHWPTEFELGKITAGVVCTSFDAKYTNPWPRAVLFLVEEGTRQFPVSADGPQIPPPSRVL